MFLKHASPGYAKHKGEHDRLTATLVKLLGRLLTGSATLSHEVPGILDTWLMDHAPGLEQEMEPFLLASGCFSRGQSAAVYSLAPS